MLKQLYLKNYALFSDTQVNFDSGLSVLTGETGAGKTLLVGALGLITGKRADNSVIFMAEEKCVVEATFGHLSESLRNQLQTHEAFDFDGDELLIRREINPNGKSRAFINDTPVSLQVLRQVSASLVDLHSQHENQSLLSNDRQRELVDAFADTEELVSRFAVQLKTCDTFGRELRLLEEKEAQSHEQLAYFREEAQQLEAAGIKADEENELEEELNLLQNSEDIREAVGGATELLYQQDESLYEQISAILEPLQKVAKVSERLTEEVQRLTSLREGLKESAFVLRDMLDLVESDPERLAFIEERLGIYHKFKLRHGVKSGAELVATLEKFQQEIEAFDSLEDQITEARARYQQAQEKLLKIGLKLEKKRIAAKPKLERNILQLLEQVGFQKARFEIAVERNVQAGGTLEVDGEWVKASPSGFNQVYFLIQANPGMPAGPLNQIASGGEISRVMLAIKASLAEKSEFPVLIFDEIDAGISGEIANKVGLVMQQLAQRFQILTITHLPQIAAKGSQHYLISKKIVGEKTYSSVASLSQSNRIHELAKMLSGDEPTESALRNAAELIGVG